MIVLKKINGNDVMVNPDLIRFIETAPDTILTFTDGEKLMVRDLPQEILQKIISFRRSFASPSLSNYSAPSLVGEI